MVLVGGSVRGVRSSSSSSSSHGPSEVLVLAAAAAVRRLFLLGLLCGHYHLYPPLPKARSPRSSPPFLLPVTWRCPPLPLPLSGAACACARASKNQQTQRARARKLGCCVPKIV